MKNSQTLTPTQRKRVEEKILAAARDRRIKCASALAIAKTLGVASHEVGRVADDLEIKICSCQLNCF